MSVIALLRRGGMHITAYIDMIDMKDTRVFRLGVAVQCIGIFW
jgi:hypothetical protein